MNNIKHYKKLNRYLIILRGINYLEDTTQRHNYKAVT
jgi:hypothetical protein